MSSDSREIENSIRELLERLPDDPGVYRFINKKNEILYIGKARNLKKRVKSYFADSKNHSYRIISMVNQAVNIEFTIVNSEGEALLLENNLIKEFQPRYNINLKDDKSYPFIVIRKEPFPRVYPTRNKIMDGSEYFGPYHSVNSMRMMLDMIRNDFKLRTCNLNLTEENIKAGKFKICLEYQLGNCGGPCEGKMKEDVYLENIDAVRKMLRGNLSQLLAVMEDKMNAFSEKLEFEKAEETRIRIEKVRQYKKRSTIFPELKGDLEVLVLDSLDDLAVITHLHLSEGSITRALSWNVKRKGESDGEIMAAGLSLLSTNQDDLDKEILSNVPFEAEDEFSGFQVKVPTSGEKKKLVDLGLKNSRILLEDLISKKHSQKPGPETLAMQMLQKDLGIPTLPKHIECFDNSNIQGTSPVASMVVFMGGKPSNKDYRHFKIKTVVGPDDFASMEEIVFRRYKRVIDENLPLPDLIVIDGGKGQLSSAASSLEKLGLIGKIPVIGIAKKLEEIYFLNDPVPLHIDKRSPALKLIQHIRNEAHRFAITFHRKVRNKNTTRTALEEIEGVGKATAQTLLKKFKSVKKILALTEEQLAEVVGPAKGKKIFEGIQKNTA